MKWSFIVLFATAAMQAFVVWISNSVALLADTIHNFADAGTAIPLWIAFVLARRPASVRFPYGLGRAEDFAGVIIVGVIFASALVALWQAVDRLIHPASVTNLLAVTGAGIVGFLDNEVAAYIREVTVVIDPNLTVAETDSLVSEIKAHAQDHLPALDHLVVETSQPRRTWTREKSPSPSTATELLANQRE